MTDSGRAGQSDTSQSGTGPPAVSVVIVNHNGGDWLERCLAALLRQSGPCFDVILFDNASSDDSLSRVTAHLDDPRIRLVRLTENIGFAAANNRAAAKSEAAWLALLNPDAIPEPDWLRRLMAAAGRHPDIGMFGSTQISMGDESRLDGAGDQYLFLGLPWRGGYGGPAGALPPEGEVFAPCAAAALYRRDTFIAEGSFDERFFCYVEDIDLAFRLRLAGARAVQVPDAVVRHVGGASTGDGASGFVRFHGTRNLIWTFVKNMPGPIFWPLLPLHAASAAVLCLKALLRGNPGPVWRGTGAAIRGLGPVWAERRRIQRARKVPAGDIARAMCWSIPKYLRRAAFTRPLDRQR